MTKILNFNKKLMTKSLIILLLTISIYGCGVTNKYVQPLTNQSSAYISFKDSSDYNNYKSAYYMMKKPTKHGCYSGGSLIAVNNPSKQVDLKTSNLNDINIESGKVISIRSILSVPILHGCRVDTVFEPKELQKYILHLDYINNQCQIKLTDDNNIEIKEVEFHHLEFAC